MKKQTLMGLTMAAMLVTPIFAEASNHVVQKGETLYSIASKYHISVSTLKSTNHLMTDLIYVGQSLMIDGASSTSPQPVLPTPAPSQNVQTQDQYYTVKSGDTLWGISFNNGVSMDSIRTWNGLKSDTLYVGQKLIVKKSIQVTVPVIPTPTEPVPTTPEPSPIVSTPSPTQNVYYTVKSGDTLWGISSKNNVSVSNIKTWNKLTSDTLYVGQKLIIQQGRSTTTPAPQTNTPQQPTQPTPSTPVAPVSQSDVKVVYTVRSGDTLWGVADAYNTTVTELQKLNNLTSGVLYVGQKITVKGKSDAPTFDIQNTINEGMKYLKVPYVWGGETPDGFDCSGLMQYIFAKNNLQLSRTSFEQWDEGAAVDAPAIGDLVFFTTYAPGASHVGMYIGDGKFLEAGSSTGVTVAEMDNSYWSSVYLGAKRPF